MSLEFFYKEIVEGGFPPGAVVIIAGEPGTGKTIFASSIVYDALKNGKKAIYVSFNEPREDYFRCMKSLGMDFEDFESFKFVDVFTVSREALDTQIELIIKEIVDFKPDFIVLDSISALTQLMKPEEVRSFLHSALARFTKSIGAVTLLIAEKPFEVEGLGYGVEEFVADGVIILRYLKYGEHERRVLEIPKMRQRRIKKPQYEYTITEKGIVFFDIPELERAEEISFEKVTTGLRELDEITNGGYYRGSITIIAGHTGTGKTTFGLHFVYKNALEGKKAVFITFEESLSSIIRAAKSYGMDLDIVKDRLIIKDWIPESLSPVYFFAKIKELIEEEKPDVLFIDSMSSLQEHMNKEELGKMIRYLQLMVKRLGIAACLTLNVGSDFATLPYTGLSTLADNIIFLKYEFGDEVRNKLVVLKTRGSKHSKRIYSYEITDRGVRIYGYS